MAARAIAKKIYVNPQALSMIRVFVSPGIDRRANIRSVKTSSAVDESKTRKDVGDNANKVKALVFDDVWKTKILEEIEETGLKLLHLVQKLRDEWRELDSKPHSFIGGDKFVFLDGPLYMDGRIYWQCRYKILRESILQFHIERETFIHIFIPKFVVQEYIDSSKHMWSMLMEVDGKVAILKSTSGEETSSLWICYHSPCGDVEWSKEEIPVPYAYVVSPGFSVEDLRRNDLIFIRSRRRISYYNRKTKASLSLKIRTSPIHDHFDCGRMTQF